MIMQNVDTILNDHENLINGYDDSDFDEIDSCKNTSKLCFYHGVPQEDQIKEFSKFKENEKISFQEISKVFKLYEIFGSNTRITGMSGFIKEKEIYFFKSINSDFFISNEIKNYISYCKVNPQICTFDCTNSTLPTSKCLKFEDSSHTIYASHPIFDNGIFYSKKLIKLCKVLNNMYFCIYGDISLSLIERMATGKFNNLTLLLGPEGTQILDDYFVLANYLKIDEEIFEFDYGGMNSDLDAGKKYLENLKFNFDSSNLPTIELVGGRVSDNM